MASYQHIKDFVLASGPLSGRSLMVTPPPSAPLCTFLTLPRLTPWWCAEVAGRQPQQVTCGKALALGPSADCSLGQGGDGSCELGADWPSSVCQPLLHLLPLSPQGSYC